MVETLDVMDLDMLDIGDDVAIGEGATITSHRFEGSQLKFEEVHPYL